MIETIQLAGMENGTPDTLDRLRRGLRETGVVFLDARGELPDGFFETLFAQSREFFRLPAEVKQALNLSNSANLRGYVGMGEEFTNGIADLKESFEFAKELEVPSDARDAPYARLYGTNLWPEPDALPQFEPTIRSYSAWMSRLGTSFLKALARTLDQPTEPTGDSLFEGEMCSFSRLIYYSDPTGFNEASARLEAHTDQALITVIVQNVAGLEVQDHTGAWVPVIPENGLFIVFPGELAEFWTRGYYRACVHRVQNKAITGERISIASFFLPDLRTRLAPLDPTSSEHLATADLTVSSTNSWLTPGGNADGALAPFVVGEKEWERMNAIFPDDAAALESGSVA